MKLKYMNKKILFFITIITATLFQSIWPSLKDSSCENCLRLERTLGLYRIGAENLQNVCTRASERKEKVQNDLDKLKKEHEELQRRYWRETSSFSFNPNFVSGVVTGCGLTIGLCCFLLVRSRCAQLN